MADDTPIELSEEELAELNFAVLCGLIAALGCATCTNGTYYRMHGVEHPLTGGGPIGLDAHEVPTRYTAMVEVPHA